MEHANILLELMKCNRIIENMRGHISPLIKWADLVIIIAIRQIMIAVYVMFVPE